NTWCLLVFRLFLTCFYSMIKFIVKILLVSEGNFLISERRSRKVRMDKIILNAEPRTITGRKVNQIRRAGKLPAVVYGSKIDPKTITLDLRDATKILANVSSSSLVTIVLKGKEYPSLVREKQIDFIMGTSK